MKLIVLSISMSVILFVGAVALHAEPVGGAANGQQRAIEQSNVTAVDEALDLIRLGKFDEAEAKLLVASKTTPDPARLYYELGCLQERRGDNLQAIASYKEGIKIYEQGRRQLQ